MTVKDNLTWKVSGYSYYFFSRPLKGVTGEARPFEGVSGEVKALEGVSGKATSLEGDDWGVRTTRG